MQYLLDTDAISAFFDVEHEKHDEINGFVDGCGNDDRLFMSVLSVYELEYSLDNCEDDEIREKIKTTIRQSQEDFDVLLLTIEGAGKFGEVKGGLKRTVGKSRENIKKDSVDCMIASSAILEDCIMVSFDEIYKTISKFTSLKIVE